MAEASAAAYGAAIGVAIAMAVVCFALRGRGPVSYTHLTLPTKA